MRPFDYQHPDNNKYPEPNGDVPAEGVRLLSWQVYSTLSASSMDLLTTLLGSLFLIINQSQARSVVKKKLIDPENLQKPKRDK